MSIVLNIQLEILALRCEFEYICDGVHSHDWVHTEHGLLITRYSPPVCPDYLGVEWLYNISIKCDPYQLCALSCIDSSMC